MPKYNVAVKKTVVCRFVVEAPSTEGARDIARVSYETGALFTPRIEKTIEHKLEGIEVKEQKYTD